MRCEHCGRETPSRRRGLCWPCYENPAVRSKFPAKTAVWLGQGYIRGHLADRATEHLPGTVGKLLVMAGRAERGEHLHHPGDQIESPEYLAFIQQIG